VRAVFNVPLTYGERSSLFGFTSNYPPTFDTARMSGSPSTGAAAIAAVPQDDTRKPSLRTDGTVPTPIAFEEGGEAAAGGVGAFSGLGTLGAQPAGLGGASGGFPGIGGLGTAPGAGTAGGAGSTGGGSGNGTPNATPGQTQNQTPGSQLGSQNQNQTVTQGNQNVTVEQFQIQGQQQQQQQKQKQKQQQQQQQTQTNCCPNMTNMVPAPPAWLLGLLGVPGFYLFRRKRKPADGAEPQTPA
jgi:hypothetical protein